MAGSGLAAAGSAFAAVGPSIVDADPHLVFGAYGAGAGLDQVDYFAMSAVDLVRITSTFVPPGQPLVSTNTLKGMLQIPPGRSPDFYYTYSGWTNTILADKLGNSLPVWFIGGISGESTALTMFRHDTDAEGVALAVVFNRGSGNGDPFGDDIGAYQHVADFNKLMNDIGAWPDFDLFDLPGVLDEVK